MVFFHIFGKLSNILGTVLEDFIWSKFLLLSICFLGLIYNPVIVISKDLMLKSALLSFPNFINLTVKYVGWNEIIYDVIYFFWNRADIVYWNERAKFRGGMPNLKARWSNGRTVSGSSRLFTCGLYRLTCRLSKSCGVCGFAVEWRVQVVSCSSKNMKTFFCWLPDQSNL